MKPRRRRARAALAWGFAGLLALQLGLAVALERGLWQFRDPFYAHKLGPLRRQWEALTEAHPAGPRNFVVVLGSSRVGNGVSGRRMADEISDALGERWTVFNLGVPAAGPLVEAMNLRRMLAEGVRPDFVLVEVMPSMLGTPPDDTVLNESRSLSTSRMARADLDVLRRARLPHAPALRSAWRQEWIAPWHTHRFSILTAAAPKLLPAAVQQNWCARCDATGWVPLVTNEAAGDAVKQQVRDLVRRQYEPVLSAYRFDPTGRNALRALLEECRSRELRVGLVLMPEGSRLRGWYRPREGQGVEALLADLRAEYGVPVVDARTWSPDADFPDAVHLLAAGAEAFSARLGREIAPHLRR